VRGRLWVRKFRAIACRLDGLYGQPFEYRLTPIMDGRARLRAIGQRLQQIGQLGVAMLFHEPRHVVGAVPTARLADDCELRRPEVRQCECAVSGHCDFGRPLYRPSALRVGAGRRRQRAPCLGRRHAAERASED
jgi:hypothetical protein